MDNELIEKQWPDFEVTCKKCQSKNVLLNDSRGYSDISGAWGSLDLVCEDCGNETEIAGA